MVAFYKQRMCFNKWVLNNVSQRNKRRLIMDKKEEKEYTIYWALERYGTSKVKAISKLEARKKAENDENFDEAELDLSPNLEEWHIVDIDED